MRKDRFEAALHQVIAHQSRNLRLIFDNENGPHGHFSVETVRAVRLLYRDTTLPLSTQVERQNPYPGVGSRLRRGGGRRFLGAGATPVPVRLAVPVLEVAAASMMAA